MIVGAVSASAQRLVVIAPNTNASALPVIHGSKFWLPVRSSVSRFTSSTYNVGWSPAALNRR